MYRKLKYSKKMALQHAKIRSGFHRCFQLDTLHIEFMRRLTEFAVQNFNFELLRSLFAGDKAQA